MRRVILTLIICWFLLFLLAVHISLNKPKNFQIIFLDVGQGDSALIKFTNGQNMLVDCGPDKKVLSKLGNYLPFYNRTIDYLAISHYDLDHYGGCIDVLKRYQVKNIIHNGSQKPDDEYWQEWNKYFNTEQVNELIINSKISITISSTTFNFLWPLQLDKNENANSLVFKIQYATTTVLFAGDLEEKSEKELIDKYCMNQKNDCPVLQSSLLKISHHGSGGSTSDIFLNAIKPHQAVISVGKNMFGHPSLRVLQKLTRNAIKIFMTNMIGDVGFSWP